MRNELITLLKEVNNNKTILDENISIDSYIDKLLDRSIIICHKEENNLIGFCSYYVNDYVKSISFLTMICVKPSHQNRGIGRLLFEYWIKNTELLGFNRLMLEVRNNNFKAINFYKGYGFSTHKDLTESILLKKTIK